MQVPRSIAAVLAVSVMAALSACSVDSEEPVKAKKNEMVYSAGTAPAKKAPKPKAKKVKEVKKPSRSGTYSVKEGAKLQKIIDEVSLKEARHLVGIIQGFGGEVNWNKVPNFASELKQAGLSRAQAQNFLEAPYRDAETTEGDVDLSKYVR